MKVCKHTNFSLRGLAGRVLVGAMTVVAVGCAIAPAMAQGKKSATAQLVQRIEQLEEQIVDMQVVIGTMQSLPRGGGAVAPAAGGGGFVAGGASDGARIDGMETQIRAMSAQLAQLAQQVRAMNANGTGNGRRGALENGLQQQPVINNAPPVIVAPQGGAVTGFGSTTVLPSTVAPGNQGGAVRPQPGNAPAVGATGPAAGQGGGTKRQYETAYGYLLQQQYGAAESAFADFVRAHPSDPLAGNAQYWLGETFFVRGQFKSAANAFLKGYETFASSRKAPDSLLKLAMSLDRLGHKDAACSSLSELKTRFPSAAAHVKKRAVSERKRVGC